MDLKELALRLYPHWIIGIVVLIATAKSKYKDLIRIEKPAIINFVKFLGMLTLYRIFLFKMFPNISFVKKAAQSINMIPPILTLTVFWEDACNGLILVLLRKLIGTDRWWKWLIHIPVLLLWMADFFAGHLYQGIIPALMLSLYVPYSIKLGKKYGFGTVMICHTLFDLTTVLTMKLIFRS
jgi:hypothetical protein